MEEKTTRSVSDPYGRVIDYMRISVTDRCNLRCFYCMPREGVKSISHGDVLRYEEILQVVDAARSMGFGKFRITGGEPLVRKGIFWLLEKLAERSIRYSLTTNGILLRRYAADLGRSGLDGINVGLDTLDRNAFIGITGQDALEEVIKGIDAVRGMGAGKVKINVVVMNGINDREIDGFVSWGRAEALDIRFIEFMPVCGRDLFVPLAPIMERIRIQYDLVPVADNGAGPARNFRYAGGGGGVGFIMPRSEPFCAACNRLRLAADGTLMPCLFSREGVPLREAIRGGKDIHRMIQKAVKSKPEGHGLKMKLHCYAMHAIGG